MSQIDSLESDKSVSLYRFILQTQKQDKLLVHGFQWTARNQKVRVHFRNVEMSHLLAEA